MKTNLHHGIILIITLIILVPVATYAQSVGKPSGNTLNFFSTNSAGKLLGHKEAGSFGTFGTSDQWIGIGQPVTFPGSTTKVPAYGLRSQWAGQAGIFSLKSASGSVKDLVVEWGSNTSSKLKFNFITDLNNPSALTEVMTLTSSKKVGIANANPSAFLDVNSNSASSTSYVTGIQNTFSGSMYSLTGITNRMTSVSCYGVTGVSSNVSGSGVYMYGGYFNVSNSNTGISTYGIYARASGSTSSLWAGYFSGDVYISGALQVASDRKFKENIAELDKREVVSKLMQLQPSSYTYRSNEQMTFAKGTQYGFVAQDVEKIFPDLVKDVIQPVYDGEDEAGNPRIVEGETLEFKSVNYLGMVPILTKAIQEHETTISAQETAISLYESEIQALKKQNEELSEKFGKLLTAIETNRGDLLKDVLETSETSLGQNEPNPFGQSSRITYTLSRSVKNATIQVYNMEGKKVGEYQLDNSKNELNIEANTYEPGVYIYALIADGKTIGTRRMIVSQ